MKLHMILAHTYQVLYQIWQCSQFFTSLASELKLLLFRLTGGVISLTQPFMPPLSEESLVEPQEEELLP